MCGLFGFVDMRKRAVCSLDIAREALNSLTHRGPDQWSEWVDGGVYIGHRRLSILDLSELGRQPMFDASGAVVSAVNGEIYNFPALRAELTAHPFRSASDSEVVPHGYSEWGIERLLEKLDGMYAFVVLDRARGKLYLARDKVGIKPLYYASIGGRFAWASELCALSRFFAADTLETDGTALYDFLTYRYVPTPKTMYKSVFKLPPGSFLEVDVQTGEFALKRYWYLDPVPSGLSDEQAVELIRECVARSVREQLVSDVPLGCFLSGGMDSSIVTFEGTRVVPTMRTFSIGFDDPRYDETRFARVASEAFGTRHTEARLDASHAVDIQAFLKSLYDEPFGDYSALPTWHVARLARQQVTVALSGDGGDELFGGYPWYQRVASIMASRGPLASMIERGPQLHYRKRPKHKLHSLMNRAALYVGSSFFELYTILMNGVPWASRAKWRELLGVPRDYDDHWYFRQHYRPELGTYKSLQVLDFNTYLPDDILTKVDRASMRESLECRVPLLGTELVKLAFSLDEKFLFRGGELKGGLKLAYKNALPEEILHRPKKGFGIPVANWKLLGDDESFEYGVLREFARVPVSP